MENRSEKEEIRVFLDESQEKKWVNEACNWIICFCYIISLAFSTMTEFAFIPPKMTGFYCRDPSLSHKYNGDTIRPEILIISSIILVPFIIYMSSLKKKPAGERTENMLEITKSHLIIECTKGVIVTLLFTSITKLSLGWHRPHFFDTCKPETAQNCTMDEFIETFTCTTYKKYSKRFITDSSLSFPSTHSSIIWFVAVFLSFVVYRSSPNGIIKPIKPIIIAIFLSSAVAITCTRITDKRHHWWDAVAGSFIGTFAALLQQLSYSCTGPSASQKNSYVKPVT